MRSRPTAWRPAQPNRTAARADASFQCSGPGRAGTPRTASRATLH